MAALCLRCGAPRTTNANNCEFCGVIFDPSAPAAGPKDLPLEFHEAMKKDDLIDAIKIYRQARGVGLKEARDEVLRLKKA